MALPLLISQPRSWSAFVALAVSLGMLSSCEKLQNGVVSEIEFPEHEPRLAVNMFVSPGDSVLYATVYQSAGITDSTGSVPLKHATVALMQGSTMLAQGDSTHWADPEPWSPWSAGSLMKITLDQPLELLPGAIALVVDASPTFAPIVVTEEVPEAPVVEHLFEAYADTVDEGWGFEYYIHRLTVDLDNRPGVRDDYMVFVEFKPEESGEPGEPDPGWFNVADPAFPDPRMEFNSGCNCLLATDNGEDNVSMANLVLEAWAGDSEFPTEGAYRLRVERPTASLANHFNSVEAYYSALGNPFAEPASIQGNIPDAFGIFGVTNEVVISLQD